MLSPDPRYWIQHSTSVDSGFHDVDSGSQVLDSRFHRSGLQISKDLFSGIPDSPIQSFLDAGVHMQKCYGFRIPGWPYKTRIFLCTQFCLLVFAALNSNIDNHIR